MNKQTLRILAWLERRRVRRAAAPTEDALRAIWISYWRTVEKRRRKWDRFEMVGPFWPRPLPEALRGLTCGARTKDGTPCESGTVEAQRPMLGAWRSQHRAADTGGEGKGSGEWWSWQDVGSPARLARSGKVTGCTTPLRREFGLLC